MQPLTAIKSGLLIYTSDSLVLMVDLIGTLLFAVEGTMAAIKGNLDLLGLLVLSFATALGGDIIRDFLIGSVPPNSIRDCRYCATAFAGGGAVFSSVNSSSMLPLPS